MAKIVRVTSTIEINMDRVAEEPGGEEVTAEKMLDIILTEIKIDSEEAWAEFDGFSTFTVSGWLASMAAHSSR